ncbi:hypothetical protein L9G74_13985 [Shewanella sp. C32]|uniref:Haem-binding uptake Tiki superfamily ChaN domain-containing protein n=1 Tax=Shewanella electrica TaxID=515560 RepID=A0ABT2FMJ5_9GAMM|nr:hypothetical protein [Shewanella electrica]MCH1926074.1 hypothetical protein [Shewanella electrica]MCS4557557.1 hypothetical protein [Shewanella electrica]
MNTRWSGFFCGLMLLCCSPISVAEQSEPQPVNELLAQQLADGKLVALGDVHGSPLIVQQLLAFLAEPQHWQQVDDIAVEFGNSRYQAVADRYVVDGAAMDLSQVRPIWRDTLYFMAWQYDVYEQLVQQLRQWNQTRTHKVRLVLAEPPLDWSSLTAQGWQQQVAQREQGYVQIITQQVLQPKRRGILLFGTFHMMKQPVVMQNGESFSSLVALLRQQQDADIYTVWPRIAGDKVSAQATAPYLLPLASSALGAQPFSHITARVGGSEPALLRDVADAYQFLASTARKAPYSHAALTDTVWHQELQRRAAIVGGRSGQQIQQWLTQHAITAPK